MTREASLWPENTVVTPNGLYSMWVVVKRQDRLKPVTLHKGAAYAEGDVILGAGANAEEAEQSARVKLAAGRAKVGELNMKGRTKVGERKLVDGGVEEWFSLVAGDWDNVFQAENLLDWGGFGSCAVF